MLELPTVQDQAGAVLDLPHVAAGRPVDDLPEAGDLEKPKLVFFFDEAHLLFNDASKQFLDAIQQTVRLIRSKGVGIFFDAVAQGRPGDVLAQLGNRVQHALRAFTPDDAKALKAAVSTYPTSEYDLNKALTSSGPARRSSPCSTRRAPRRPSRGPGCVPPSRSWRAGAARDVDADHRRQPLNRGVCDGAGPPVGLRDAQRGDPGGDGCGGRRRGGRGAGEGRRCRSGRHRPRPTPRRPRRRSGPRPRPTRPGCRPRRSRAGSASPRRGRRLARRQPRPSARRPSRRWSSRSSATRRSSPCCARPAPLSAARSRGASSARPAAADRTATRIPGRITESAVLAANSGIRPGMRPPAAIVKGDRCSPGRVLGVPTRRTSPIRPRGRQRVRTASATRRPSTPTANTHAPATTAPRQRRDEHETADDPEDVPRPRPPAVRLVLVIADALATA